MLRFAIATRIIYSELEYIYLDEYIVLSSKEKKTIWLLEILVVLLFK